MIIESDKMIINDFHIIEEMSTYVQKSKERRSNDDFMTCLVIFKSSSQPEIL